MQERRHKRKADGNKWYHPEEQDQYVMMFNGPEKCLIEMMAAAGGSLTMYTQ